MVAVIIKFQGGAFFDGIQFQILPAKISPAFTADPNQCLPDISEVKKCLPLLRQLLEGICHLTVMHDLAGAGDAVWSPRFRMQTQRSRAGLDNRGNDVGDVVLQLIDRHAVSRCVAGRLNDGAQGKPAKVAVIAPTTLLARQHYKSFAERFRGFPLEVRALSRFVSAGEADKTRDGLARGTVDIVIGTHALLAKSVRFKNLGLLISDEEQHFGVSHKERLKQMRSDVHVLTLTATPIPRTLQLSLSGVRDLSIIGTPPVDRLAIRTYVSEFDGVTIREQLDEVTQRSRKVIIESRGSDYRPRVSIKDKETGQTVIPAATKVAS